MQIVRDKKGRFAKNNKSGGRPVGFKVTQETKRKISISRMGITFSSAQKEKIRQANLGRKASMETRLKMSLQRTGELNSQWRGGVSNYNRRIRNTIPYKVWRESVFRRDDWTCQECGRRGVELHPHHIKSFARYPELRFDVDNGQTLCVKCHEQTDNYKAKWLKSKK